MKNLLFYVLCFALAACSVTDKSGKSGLYESPNYKCLEQQGVYDAKEKKGPVTLSLNIDSIIVGQARMAINKNLKVQVDKESPLIELNDTFAVKFFHVEAVKYGKRKHMIAYTFFIRGTDCWEQRVDFSFTEVYVSSPTFSSTIGSASQGFEGDAEFLKIVWKVSRVK